MAEHALISAAYGRPHDYIPAWIMRQAGRYLPQYREIKKRHTFSEICDSPKLMAEVSLQPVDIIGTDAAIIFSDILLPLKPLGLNLSFSENGPQIANPIRTPDDIEHLREYNPEKALSVVLDGIRTLKKRLSGKVPVIGFVGSPFTLACYAIEGRGSTSGEQIKKFLYQNRAKGEQLLEMLADITGQYLKAQIEAGAEMIQIFDSRGALLSTDEYKSFSLPYIEKVCTLCHVSGVPRALYVNGTSPYLQMLADIDCEAISIDGQTDIREAFSILEGKTVQGNLDPALLTASEDILRQETTKLLDTIGYRDNFIFNLGHGILPQTPVANARIAIEIVHKHLMPNRINQA